MTVRKAKMGKRVYNLTEVPSRSIVGLCVMPPKTQQGDLIIPSGNSQEALTGTMHEALHAAEIVPHGYIDKRDEADNDATDYAGKLMWGLDWRRVDRAAVARAVRFKTVKARHDALERLLKVRL